MNFEDDEVPVPRHILFIFALFGKTREQIRANMLLKPRKLLKYFQCIMSEDGRTESLIQRARNLSTKMQQIMPCPAATPVTDQQKEYIGYILNNFRWKCKHILGNSPPSGCRSSPPAQIKAVTLTFIRYWNSIINALNGKWLFLYGPINKSDLEIQDICQFTSLLQFCIKYKLLKHVNDLTRIEYDRNKRWGNTVIEILTANYRFEQGREMIMTLQRNRSIEVWIWLFQTVFNNFP